MLLEQAGTQRHRAQAGPDVQRVIGQADRQSREIRAQLADRAEAHLLVGRGIHARAMHERERRAVVPDGRHRAAHRGDVVHAGGEDHRLAHLRDVLEQRNVVAFAGADLETPARPSRPADPPLRARKASTGTSRPCLAVRLDAPLLVRGELAALDDVPEPLFGDLARRHVRRDHLLLGDVALELHHFRAGADRRVDELRCALSKLPSWLMPTSAMTNGFSSGPILRPPRLNVSAINFPERCS